MYSCAQPLCNSTYSLVYFTSPIKIDRYLDLYRLDGPILLQIQDVIIGKFIDIFSDFIYHTCTINNHCTILQGKEKTKRAYVRSAHEGYSWAISYFQ